MSTHRFSRVVAAFLATGALSACDGRIGEPRALWALWLLPVLVVFYAATLRARARSLRRFAAPSMLERLAGAGGARRRVLKAALIVAAVAALLLALARVQVGYTWQHVERKGVDIVVALDVSDSMLVADAGSVHRLERAKRELQDLLRILTGDRIGIVAFAGAAFVQCPLTLDYGAAELFLRALDQDTIPVQGTDLEQALLTSLAAFRGGGAGSRAVLLITDGEDHSGQALEAAEALRAEEVRVFAIGIGSTEGAPVPARGGGFRRDRAGAIVLSRLDEPTLQQIAMTTGGRYVRSVTGDLDLETIYVDGIKAALAERAFDAERRQRWEDRFQWLVAAALLLLMAEALIPERGAARRAMAGHAAAPAAPSARRGRDGEAESEGRAGARQAPPDGTLAREGGSRSARSAAAVLLALVASSPAGVRGQDRAQDRPHQRAEANETDSTADSSASREGASVVGTRPARDAVAAEETYRTPEEAYAAGAFGQALQGFLDLQVERPEDPAVAMNVGSAHYRLGDFEAAARSFESAAAAADDRLRAQAWYDFGNVAYRAGRLDEAIEHWHRSLDLDPTDADAKWNLELAQAERTRQQEQRQQQQQQHQGQQDQQQQGEREGQRDPQSGGERQDPGAGDDASRDDASEDEEPSQDQQEQAAGSEQRDGDQQRVPGDSAEQRAGRSGAEQSGEPGQLTAAEVERLLEGLAEGRPRRRLEASRRRSMEKDW